MAEPIRPLHPNDDGYDWAAFEQRVAEVEAENRQPPKRRFDEWRTTTFSGALLSAVAITLQQIFDPNRREEPVIEIVDSGPPVPDPVELHFDADVPAASFAVIRPSRIPKA